MKIRNYYHTLDMNRTLLKGYVHLLYFFYIIYYHINLTPLILSMFFSSLLHIIDFENLFIEKIIFFFDYFFVIYSCYYAFVDRCSSFILELLFYGVATFLYVLTTCFLSLIEISFPLFRHIYHGGFVIFLLFYIIILYPTNNSLLIDIKAFYNILLPIMFILLIKVLPFDLNNRYIDIHDIFQFLSVFFTTYIIYYY